MAAEVGRRYGNRAGSLLGTVVLSGAAALALAGCGDDSQGQRADQDVYCVDQDGHVLDEDRCQGDNHSSSGAGFFFMMINSGGQRYSPGQTIPSRYRNASTTRLVDPRSSSARRSAGLPATGKVTSGTRISGGLGTGSVSGGGKGGSAGGAKGGSGGG